MVTNADDTEPANRADPGKSESRPVEMVTGQAPPAAARQKAERLADDEARSPVGIDGEPFRPQRFPCRLFALAGIAGRGERGTAQAVGGCPGQGLALGH